MLLLIMLIYLAITMKNGTLTVFVISSNQRQQILSYFKKFIISMVISKGCASISKKSSVLTTALFLNYLIIGNMGCVYCHDIPLKIGIRFALVETQGICLCTL